MVGIIAPGGPAMGGGGIGEEEGAEGILGGGGWLAIGAAGIGGIGGGAPLAAPGPSRGPPAMPLAGGGGGIAAPIAWFPFDGIAPVIPAAAFGGGGGRAAPAIIVVGGAMGFPASPESAVCCGWSGAALPPIPCPGGMR